ncbi:MAG: Fe(3+) ABC transporter substrate-binding protein [Gammaproteobacteria bacterium]
MLRRVIGLGLCLVVVATQAAEVNVYSAREEALIKPLLDEFSTVHGTTVNLVTGDADALLKRLESEGQNSPADLILTTDVGRLLRAQEAGLLQPVESKALQEAIPAQYRDVEHQWFGVSLRSRVVVYAQDRVKPSDLSTYEDLADPKWKGKICVRSSNNVYNQSLVAAMIAHDGSKKTEQWAGGFVASFARPPAGGDREQIKAVAAGRCDLALVNTYYLAGMLHSDDPAEQEAAGKVALLWPDQGGRGAHVNISGAGVTKAAKNRVQAVRLLEFMVSDEAQRWYAEMNFEYPVKPGVAVSATLQAWGEFKADDLSLSLLGRYNAEAVRLMDRAGWK